ncbi:MAG: hypothetical protein PWQ30_752 [Euryarchaeota archaeon]|nr:hypothetical protein [Euryarchaeota archaeon]
MNFLIFTHKMRVINLAFNSCVYISIRLLHQASNFVFSKKEPDYRPHLLGYLFSLMKLRRNCFY